ncbi:autotransporter outer membrane beta-barrel domain-containing protein [Escherichia coli]|nr:autotransporter outer membrane beta-barrel domain-containing protein [Escherichia coli]
MNKIYSLKYSASTGGLIAVSELAKKVSGKTPRQRKIHKKLALIATISMSSLLIMPDVQANQIYTSNIWSRDYFDLAQNKGPFKAGSENVSIDLKNGKQLLFPTSIPDFSPTDSMGANTSIGGAYSVTAAHNDIVHKAIGQQTWGATTYNFVTRMSNNSDFAVQRLNKFVVETTGLTDYVDSTLTAEQALQRYGIDTNQGRKIIGFRAGAGQLIINNKQTDINYRPETLSASMFVLTHWSQHAVDNAFTDFRNETTGGDSGSGYYLYDNENKKWVILGTHHGLAHGGAKQYSVYNAYDNNLVKKLKDYYTQKITLDGKTITINNNTYTDSGEKKQIESTGATGLKDILFSGGGNINLTSNLDLNYGGLIFNSGDKYTVNGENVTFKGAGIDIAKDTTVIWNTKYAKNDNLHKIGEGTLDVTKSQETNLKTGNGTVILNAENSFNNIYIAGGKATVKINHENAISGNNDTGGIFFTNNGGTLELNGYDKSFNRIAATDNAATIINTADKTSNVTINNNAPYIYHGQFKGNINLINENKADNAPLILDGDIDVSGHLTANNTNIIMQGHATEHALLRNGGQFCYIPNILCETDYVYYLSEADNQANVLYNSGYKNNNQRVSLSQPDWDSRTFKFGSLILNNSQFKTGRDSHVEGTILAKKSNIVLGDDTLYIDLYAGSNINNNGFGFQQNVQSGKSPVNIANTSSYKGSIELSDKSELTINNIFEGGIDAVDSKIEINSSHVTLNRTSYFVNSEFNINKNAEILSETSLFSTSPLNVSGEITFTGTPVAGTQSYTPTVNILYGGLKLNDGGKIIVRDQTSLSADITATEDHNVTLLFGNNESDINNLADSADKIFTSGLLSGFNTAYQGSINLAKGNASFNNTWWTVTDDSRLNKLNTKDSFTQFSNGNNGGFHKLEINELTTNNSAFVIRTDLKKSDQLIVKNKLDGKGNHLLVDFISQNGKKNGLNIPLIIAPKETSENVFNGATQTVGFSDVTPVIATNSDNGNTTWTLTGFEVKANPQSAKIAQDYLSTGYKAFLAEVNNLNKRMGDLRDINGEAGAWARIMSGTGSAGGGFSDNYTHVQVGADKKHELDGLDLFTGVTMTYTDSHAGSDAFSGETKSVGAGLYASAMFESGAYIDLIGKYVHHDNEYTATFAGLGTRDYSSHSWYAGAEVGYRYHVTDSAWIEPQAELVYGAISGKQFSWKDQGMNLTMKDKDFNPLIGRTGLDVGKSFSGKDWKVTARAGLGYQFDLFANGETVLRDASGKKRIKGEKDGRMLMNVGLNAEIRDNVRFGLEFEKSAFGKYNVDNAVNANFRYSF